MKLFRRTWYKIRVGSINTHAGLGLHAGVVAWLLKRHPLIDIFTFQEVRSRKALVDALPPSYTVFPKVDVDSTQYIAYKRDKFSLIYVIRRDITNSVHERDMLMLVLVHRKTNRGIVVSDLHPNPLGRGLNHGDEGAVRKHTNQVEAFVMAHSEQQDLLDDVQICAGDGNERLDEQHPDSARNQFAEINMHPSAFTADKTSGPIRLMVIYTSHGPKTQVLWHRSYDTGIQGMDHEVVAACLKIRHPNR